MKDAPGSAKTNSAGSQDRKNTDFQTGQGVAFRNRTVATKIEAWDVADIQSAS
jgi:hypothetical protein